MRLYLVRHAKAGSRRDFDGDDRDRPLSRAGLEQAHGLTVMLGHLPISRIYSSPYLRCTQSVEPLAKKLGLELKLTEALSEWEGPGAPDFSAAVTLVEKAPNNALLCSHGDVIPAVLDALQRRGLVIKGDYDMHKAVTWVVERKGGQWRRAKVFPPPL
jgi:8-oxo-dGTP diphosphatase